MTLPWEGVWSRTKLRWIMSQKSYPLSRHGHEQDHLWGSLHQLGRTCLKETCFKRFRLTRRYPAPKMNFSEQFIGFWFTNWASNVIKTWSSNLLNKSYLWSKNLWIKPQICVYLDSIRTEFATLQKRCCLLGVAPVAMKFLSAKIIEFLALIHRQVC